jgi:peptidoglycan/xylan/chitin deacetylase (PgdA/CDA1 family)
MALACGGFDERFKSRRDDLELGLRLQRAGVRFHYQPEAITYELYTKSASDLLHSDGTCLGRNEILLSRTHPDYRSCSALARLDEGPWWRQLARRLAAAAPLSPDFLLRAPYWLAERLRRFLGPRRAGVRLLELRLAIEFYRSALREAGSFKALRHEFGMRLPVLLYHRVAVRSSSEYPSLTVSAKKFERQVRWLAKQGYVGIRASDWLAWCHEGKALPEKPVLFTFDDAYADLTEYALPVLQRYGFSAVVFVVTGKLGGTNDWDRGKWAADLPLMTADQVRYWANQGIEFGAHTRTHRDLTILTDAELADEIAGSAEDLKQLLGAPATSFAYPHGSYNPPVQDHVRRVFQAAFTVDEGFNTISSDPHLLRRIMVGPGDLSIDFAWRLWFARIPLAHLRARLRLRTRAKRAIGWLRPAHE